MFKFFFLIFFLISLKNLNANFYPWDDDVKFSSNENYVTKNEEYITSSLGWVMIRFVRFFQIYISPQDGPNCRYKPTCSQYILICIKRYGALKGLIMTSDRYLRCNPLGAWGRDLPEENYFFGKNED